MLVYPHQYIGEALKGGWAIGAFNTSNLEITQAIIAAAGQVRSPVIVQTSEGAIAYAGLHNIAGLVAGAAAASPVPVILHLDHGKSVAAAAACIEAGYTSVMFDASKKSLVDNIRATREVVDFAHRAGVWVEAEVGAILGAEGAHSLKGSKTPDDLLTNPKQARQFVEETGIDALAVSVGTIHGAFTGQEYVRFELLAELEKIVPDVPLVMHGASGLARESLERVAKSHVCKINIDTEIRMAVEEAIRAYFKTTHETTDYRDIFGAARVAAQLVVEEKLKLFGSAQKEPV